MRNETLPNAIGTKKDVTEGMPDEWLRVTSQEPPRII